MLTYSRRRRVAGSSDFISQLPHPILHKILYHVPVNDAGRTAVLSKTWLQVWNTLPFLDFRALYGPYGINSEEKNLILLPYVDRILSKRKNQGLTVHKFTFGGRFPPNISSYVERWIEILRDLHVYDFCVSSSYMIDDECFALPETILSAKSIKYLELGGFNLNTLSGNVVKWPLLQKLYLNEVHVSDDLIREIVNNCCGIEDLQFYRCIGFKGVTISNLVKLRRFCLREAYLEESPKVHINTPSLEYFSYEFQEKQNCFNINPCTRLKTLILCGRSITQDWVEKLFSLFPLLEHLSLELCTFDKVKISSCNLKHLCLRYCRDLIEANIDTPNLSTFEYCGNGALIFSLNASPLLQVNVRVCPTFTVNLPACAKVTEFLRVIGYYEIVCLSGSCFKQLVFPKKIRDRLDYSGCELKNLLIYTGLEPDSEFLVTALDLLDYLLRVYSQLESLCIITNQDDLIDCLKFLSDKLREEEEILHCCDSLPIKCWRHFLKEVICETPENDEAQRHRNILGCMRDTDKIKILRIQLKPR